MQTCGEIFDGALKRSMLLANKLYEHENFLSAYGEKMFRGFSSLFFKFFFFLGLDI